MRIREELASLTVKKRMLKIAVSDSMISRKDRATIKVPAANNNRPIRKKTLLKAEAVGITTKTRNIRLFGDLGRRSGRGISHEIEMKGQERNIGPAPDRIVATGAILHIVEPLAKVGDGIAVEVQGHMNGRRNDPTQGGPDHTNHDARTTTVDELSEALATTLTTKEA